MTTLLDIDEPCLSFGKHKGKGYSEALKDEPWILWCIQNGVLQTREPNLYQIYMNHTISPVDDNCTPEHNKLQNHFMKSDTINSLLKLSYKERIERLNDVLKPFDLHFYKFNSQWVFESYFNWDVQLHFTTCFFRDSKEKDYTSDEVKCLLKEYPKLNNFENLIDNIQMDVHIIELKPSVGDDYPNILRKMIKQSQNMYIDRGPQGYKEMELWRENRWKPVKVPANQVFPHRMYLILENFNSTSTEFEELKEIFKKSDIDVYIFDHLKSLSDV
jgi:hypothetical protein